MREGKKVHHQSKIPPGIQAMAMENRVKIKKKKKIIIKIIITQTLKKRFKLTCFRKTLFDQKSSGHIVKSLR